MASPSDSMLLSLSSTFLIQQAVFSPADLPILILAIVIGGLILLTIIIILALFVGIRESRHPRPDINP